MIKFIPFFVCEYCGTVMNRSLHILSICLFHKLDMCFALDMQSSMARYVTFGNEKEPETRGQQHKCRMQKAKCRIANSRGMIKFIPFLFVNFGTVMNRSLHILSICLFHKLDMLPSVTRKNQRRMACWFLTIIPNS